MSIVKVQFRQDLSDMRFTRSPSGHIHSPWWTYDWRAFDDESPYTIGSKFHQIREASIRAFCDALQVNSNHVICSQRKDRVTGQIEWRLSTSLPCQLPIYRPVKRIEPGSIDVPAKLIE